MSALRVEIQSGQFLASPFPLILDCWKAELLLTRDPAVTNFAVNGVEISGAFFPSTGGGGDLSMVLEFGGMMRDGKPVNLNQNLTFTGTFSRPAFYFLTKTYFDPSLRDPMKR